MQQTIKSSRIEIWSNKYINSPQGRIESDKNARIVQIESIPGTTTDFIVEVVDDERPTDK